MAEQLPNPAELREQARRHRTAALEMPESQVRKQRLSLADEFDRLADAIETEGHRAADKS